MNIWIWPTTPGSWQIVKSNNVWAVDTETKGRRVLPDDKIIFYVNGTGYFHGAYRVKNQWHKATTRWPDKKHTGDHAYEIDLEEIQLGFASFNQLLPSLKFVEKKSKASRGPYLRGTVMGPANFGKPISEEDYRLILNELIRVSEEPNFSEAKEDSEELVEIPEKPYESAKIPPPDKKTLEEIFQDVEKGRCAVPDFQRYWTWTKKQIEELWESIFKGYYVGSLLTWQAYEQKLEKTSIKGGPEELGSDPDLILDGQQRITAIYYAVKAPNISLPNTDNPYEFFLNINALLDHERDSSEIINSESRAKAEHKKLHDRRVQYEKKIFPLTLFNKDDYSEWVFGFYDYLKNSEGYDEEDAKKYRQLLSKIFREVWSSYEIPVVKLPESLELDNVAAVFERINSKGTRLGIFDLLNARFSTYGIVLKDQFEDVKNRHDNIKKWHKDFKSDKVPLYIIQALALVKSGSHNRKTVLKLDELYEISGEFDPNRFLEDWNEMAGYVEKAITRVTSTDPEGFGAVNYDFIPYTSMIPLIASLLKEIEDRPNRISCLNKIRLWYWTNVLGDRYSGSTDSTIASDLKTMKKWFGGDGTPNQFEREEHDDFNTSKNTSALYKAVICVIAKKGALDFVRGDPFRYGKMEDHHIFPRSKQKQFGAGKDIDSVLNRTLIFGETNRFFSNQSPSKYLAAIMDDQNIGKVELQKNLSTHLISKEAFECLLADNFKGFIKEREKTIRGEFQRLVCPDADDTPSDIRELLKREDKNVEFKQTLRWDIRKNQVNPALEETVMKELACFMNADGGKILIGVDDSGRPTGLEPDYQTFKKKNSGDFQEHLTNLVNKHLGKNANPWIEWNFHQIDGKEICLGTVSRSPGPVYVRIKNEKKFYARNNNTCQPYDVEEAHDYVSKHWS